MKDSVPTILVCSVCSDLYLVLGFDILVLSDELLQSNAKCFSTAILLIAYKLQAILCGYIFLLFPSF